jgi:hypothetical protein
MYNKENIKIALDELKKIESDLNIKKSSHAGKIKRIAQDLSNYDSMLQNYDPGQDYGQGQDQVQPFASDNAPSMETTINGETEKVPIESFVKPPETEVHPDYNTHTCTVVFKAPPDIKESDMMNYILGIGEALHVDVDSFKWAKLDTANKTK